MTNSVDNVHISLHTIDPQVNAHPQNRPYSPYVSPFSPLSVTYKQDIPGPRCAEEVQPWA